MPHIVFDSNASRFLGLSGCGMKLIRLHAGYVPLIASLSMPPVVWGNLHQQSQCCGESRALLLPWQPFAANPGLGDTAASSLFAFSDHAFCKAVSLGNARGGCGDTPTELLCCADQFVRIVAMEGLYLFLRSSPLFECFDGVVKRPCCGWVTVQPIGPPIVQHPS